MADVPVTFYMQTFDYANLTDQEYNAAAGSFNTVTCVNTSGTALCSKLCIPGVNDDRILYTPNFVRSMNIASALILWEGTKTIIADSSDEIYTIGPITFYKELGLVFSRDNYTSEDIVAIAIRENANNISYVGKDTTFHLSLNAPGQDRITKNLFDK